jgi:hypothetical protein
MDKEEHLKTWGLLYCGDAGKLEQALQEVATELKIDLHSESFAW